MTNPSCCKFPGGAINLPMNSSVTKWCEIMWSLPVSDCHHRKWSGGGGGSPLLILTTVNICESVTLSGWFALGSCRLVMKTSVDWMALFRKSRVAFTEQRRFSLVSTWLPISARRLTMWVRSSISATFFIRLTCWSRQQLRYSTLHRCAWAYLK